jgi:hypothetical protein
MNHIYRLSLVLAGSLTSTVYAVTKTPEAHDNKLITLTSEMLSFTDGKSWGITPDHIGFTWQLLRELQKMQDGIKDNNGNYCGIFTVADQQHSVKTLRKLEVDYELALAEHRNDAQLTKKRSLLSEALAEGKAHFNAKVLPFLGHTHGLKKLLTLLIEESCTGRNRADSYLRTWGQCEEGKESENFEKDVKSFKALDTFLTDLINFLKDFIHSCPKAREQFLAMVKQKLGSNQGGMDKK